MALLSSYASNLDVMDDVRLLNESLGIRKICLVMMRFASLCELTFSISGSFLKICIEKGLTPNEIASLYIRSDSSPDTPSLLEKIVQECVEQVLTYQSIKQIESGSSLSWI